MSKKFFLNIKITITFDFPSQESKEISVMFFSNFSQGITHMTCDIWLGTCVTYFFWKCQKNHKKGENNLTKLLKVPKTAEMCQKSV